MEEHAQAFATRGFQVGVTRENEGGIVSRRGKKVAMDGQIRHAEIGQARLPHAEHFAGTAQA